MTTTTDAPARKGDFIITRSGKHFWPLDARPEEVEIEDIAHALSMVTRWTGHAPIRHSVALHCIHVSYRAEELTRTANVNAPRNGAWAGMPKRVALAGLLHDASEAYLSDIAKPVKPHLTNYYEIEAGLQRVIGQKFGVTLEPLPAPVVQADLDLLVTEASVFFPEETWWRPGATQSKHQAGGTILDDARVLRDLSHDILWEAVKAAFLHRFEELSA